MSPQPARALPNVALELARVFAGGGRLVAVAPGRHDHARHIAVEFVHPAVTGARSLPALAATVDEVGVIGAAEALIVIEPTGPRGAGRVETRAVDDNASPLVVRVPGDLAEADIVRWYHILWELVQVSLEHPGIAGGSARRGGDSTGFLYPFLDAGESDSSALLAALDVSAEAKRAEADLLGVRTVAANATALDAAGAAIADRIGTGGRVYTIGNGGSACDAARLARLLTDRRVPATCLAWDPVVLSALANDLGAEHIFSRQVEAHVRVGDVLVALSTSGASRNLLRAFDAVAPEVCVVGCAGYGGGPLTAHERVDHSMLVESTSVHRIQEAQNRLIDALVERVAAHGLVAT